MSIGFKEWALVCEALDDGRQSIILRKGGIAEGRDGFQFKHEEFFLFPTLFHEQVARTKLPPDTRVPHPGGNGAIEIRLFARAEWTHRITDPEIVAALDAFHIWSAAEIENRFRYEDAGLNLAFVRVFRLDEPWRFPDASKYGGCRSWVTLPEAPRLDLQPVLDDETHAARADELRRLISR